MHTVTIEIFSEAYKDEVSKLILAIQRDEFDIPITLDMQPDLNSIPGFYQNKKGNFWVAKINDKIAGTIGLLDIGDNKAALRKMFVAKEFRGKEFGIAENLLKTLINWAKELNIGEVLLGTTEKFTRAHRFYEKNGFTEIEKQALPKQFPVMDVDVKFYKYAIS
jgi:GNAT superfamily N-acetyltransferase